MEKDVNHTNFKAGYAGHDSMREKAITELGRSEYHRLEAGNDRPGSFSAMSRTPMRKYKKGGHVEHEDHQESLMTDIIKRAKRNPEKLTKEAIEMMKMAQTKGSPYKKGGHTKIMGKISGSFMKHGIPHGNIDGGSLTNLHIPKEMGFGKSLKSPHLHIKKGNPMKKGGHHKEHHEHHEHHMKHAHGGSIYEHEMDGEHPSRSFHRTDYEGMMRGEHPIYRSTSKSEHEHRYAAGGAAKVRHEEATPSGRPIHHRQCKVKVY